VVQDNWDRYVALIKMFWEKRWQTGLVLWDSLQDLCVSLYIRIRWTVVDSYERLVYVLSTSYTRLFLFLSDPLGFIWGFILTGAETTVKKYKAQFQGTCEHCLRYLWEGVW
jgi:hypothetical protein